MNRKYLWLKFATAFQLITAVIHSLSFFVAPQPTNETEEKMVELMTTYQMDMGSGFTPTMYQMMTGLSVCFTLVMLLGAGINWRLIVRKVDAKFEKEVIGISSIIFGACFFTMLFLTFLPPVILTGLVFLSLLLAFISDKPRV